MLGMGSLVLYYYFHDFVSVSLRSNFYAGLVGFQFEKLVGHMEVVVIVLDQ